MACWRREALAFLATTAAFGAPLFRAGATAVDITPRGLPIVVSGGFLAATAERIAGQLYARALALDDGREPVLIAVVDTLMMPRELVDRVKAAASKSTGIPADRMLISATHTHSAPPVMGALGTDANPEYAQLLEAQLVKAIEGAVRNLAPARLGWAVIQDWEHTHCRRWILRPDRLRKDPFGELTVRANMHPGYQNPDFIGPAGPVDPDLTVLAFQSPKGRPIALLANYSMHYVGAGGKVVSPDYYGPFVENLQHRIGTPGADRPFIAMMSQGTSGDQHWMDYSRPRQEMTPQVYADALAETAFEAYRKITYRDWVPLRMREARLTLSRRVPDAGRLAWARRIVAGMGGDAPRNQQEVYAREQILLAAEPVRELKLQALRIGELGIAAVPNEVFALTGLKIKAQSPLQPTFNIELANGSEGYIPPPEQHELGGYTTWPARTAALEVQAEPRIVETILTLLESVSGKRRRPPLQTAGPYAKAVLASRPLAFWRGNEFKGPTAVDAAGRHHAVYEDGIAFYLEGPPLAGEHLNRAPHFADGRMKVPPKTLPERYTVEMWFWNGLPFDARPVTGYLLDLGDEQLAIGGTARTAGKLLFVRGGAVFEGTTPIALKTWQHVALVRDREHLAVYLNGAAEITGVAEPALRAAEVFIGGSSDNSANFEGRLDEIALFARPLSAAELARHYLACVQGNGRASASRVREHSVSVGFLGALRLGEGSYYVRNRPGASFGYGFRFHPLFQIDLGLDYVPRPLGSAVCCRFLRSADDHLFLLPLGGRLIFSPGGGRCRFALGGGGAYMNHRVNRQYGALFPLPRTGWGAYGSVHVSAALRRGSSWRLGGASRLYLIGPTEWSRARVLTVGPELSIAF